MFSFFQCSFQWWLLSLRLCPLATKHQPASWVIVCGYNSVGCDQYVTESGMFTRQPHPVSLCTYPHAWSLLDSGGHLMDVFSCTGKSRCLGTKWQTAITPWILEATIWDQVYLPVQRGSTHLSSMLSSNSFQTREAPTSPTCSRACTAGQATLEVRGDTAGGETRLYFPKTWRTKMYHRI